MKLKEVQMGANTSLTTTPLLYLQKYDISQPIHLKKGIYELNRDPNFNYQLNRVINWDGGRLEDI